MNDSDAMTTDAEQAQWPEAVEVINEHGRSPIVLICEHASNYMPPEYHGLGLDAAELSRHIAWDIGAADVTRGLSRRLDAPAFLGTYSRLLIDLNRPLDAASSIPVRSEATQIGGNLGLGRAERERRVRQIFMPFHARIAAHIESRERTGRRSVIVAVHTFTRNYLDSTRPWDAGILFGQAHALAESVIGRLRSDPKLNVAANVPYGVSAQDDYGLLVYGDFRGNPAVLVEIRNDLVATAAGADQWAQRLASALAQRSRT